MSAELLHYRPWNGTLRHPLCSVWPIARVALVMIFRRKLFWALYGLALTMFLVFFFGQYLLSWAESQAGESSVRVLGAAVPPGQLIHIFRQFLELDGRKGEMYSNFFAYQAHMVMIVLALAGSMLVGSDINQGSLAFYLSKPISRVHYVLGKCLAVAVFVNMMTTVPAIILWAQFGILDTWSFFVDKFDLFLGILGYGLILTLCMSLLLVATAACVRRTVPMIMTWCTLFFFCPVLSNALVRVLGFDVNWRLIDLWNCAFCVGSWMLSASPGRNQPGVAVCAVVLASVSCLCLTYLILRIRAVEIVK
jgi:ABC-type transport system involved in multi-copper enzyme maturation permease subunit